MNNPAKAISGEAQQRADTSRQGAAAELQTIGDNPHRSLADIIAGHARNRPDSNAVIFENRTLNYRDFDRRINQFARWAKAQNIGTGDRVVVIMANGPDYLALWLGLSRIGAIAVLINTNLAGAPLQHAFEVAGARLAVASTRYQAQLQSLPANTLAEIQLHWHGTGASALSAAASLETQLEAMDGELLTPGESHGSHVDDVALYMYTSGTTGNPKAARVTHRRILMMGLGIAGVVAAGPDDVVLDVLPMYHGSGGLCAPGLAFAHGGTLVIEDSFSASRFWDICCDHGVTLFEYVGEVCRYLANSPPHQREREHQLRAFVGAGLRASVWQTLETRFRIPWIVEFYGSTEGNVSMTNFEGRIGAIGRIRGSNDSTAPVRLIRINSDTDMPLRGPDGAIQFCRTGEIGEAIGRIGTSRQAGGRRFEGYSDAAATAKKILNDVVTPGDAWFRTGDAMYCDAEEFYYFVDRIGDTFRWKSENVATVEVADVLTAVTGVLEAVVYGVEVPENEGRAGMAVVFIEPNSFELAALAKHVRNELSAYARPQFLRLSDRVTVTGTYKYRKVEFVEQGYDPGKIADALFIWDREGAAYRPLTSAIYETVKAGNYRF